MCAKSFVWCGAIPSDPQGRLGGGSAFGLRKQKGTASMRMLFLFCIAPLKKISHENPYGITVSVHKDVFSYERLVATSVMEAAAFSLSMVDHGLDDSAIASISFMVARSTSPTPVK